jgi:endonuclease III
MGVSIRSAKRPFQIHAVIRRIRREVKQFADAAMFDLAAQGFTSPFHQLVACIISVRTLDEVSLPAALRLFKLASEEFGGELPCDFEVLTSFRGVGPKCANLTLGIACGATEISVDVHVHRVTNRWGLVRASTPEATRLVLEERLPKKYWVEINRLLVPFGKHICTGRLPKCSVCPVLQYCRQVGVAEHR